MRNYEASGVVLAMDVVNGKIVDTLLEAGTEATTSRGERRIMADQQHAWGGGKPTRGLGFVADARRGDSERPQQQQQHASAGSFGQWTPAGATLEMFVGDPTAPLTPAGLAPAVPRWSPRAPERGGRGAHDFTGGQDHCRQGWKRAGLGAGTEQESSRSAEVAKYHGGPQALGLKPSHARAVDGGRAVSSRDQRPGSFVRAAAANGAPTWASPGSPFEPMASPGGSGALAAPSRPMVDAAGRDHGSPQLDHRQGWKWNTSPRWGSSDSPRQYHFDASSCTEDKLDEEMTMFESQLTRTVSGHFSNRTSVTSSRSPEISEASALVVTVAAAASSSSEKKCEELVTATTSVLKRKRSGLSDGDTQGEWGWTQPLKLLVRKGLTVSDVGELGRIIVPKKDAEGQSFPQIETKEGTVLEMEDYTASKRWYFRFKYWINNKSRMYVLENTGDFIKFHCLKEHDIFVIYEDDCKKLIVCGQKKKNGESLDPVLEVPKSSTSETTPTPTEDESSHLHHQHR